MGLLRAGRKGQGAESEYLESGAGQVGPQGPGGELQFVYDALVPEFRRLAATGGTVEHVRYGVTLRGLKWHLEHHYLSVGTYTNPYRHIEAADDEMVYSYREAGSDFQVRRFHWYPGLTPEQLELYQTFRRDGASFERAAEAAQILVPS